MKKEVKKDMLSKDKYHVVIWDKADIASFLALHGVDQAVFNFDKSWGKYKLSVTGFDTYGNLVGTSTLTKYAKKDGSDLDNLYLGGLFFLKANVIASNSANGTKSLYFVPKPYIVDPGLKYVSYDVYDDEHFVETLLVNSINPSPPYVK